MTWFKVDDTFPLHAKVLAAGNASVGLWVRAGAWSMQQLTDGFIPQHVARTLGTPGEAKRLVTVGLWVDAEGGYQFHQWTEVQRTKEQVEADRHAASERQRHARDRAKSQRESRRDAGVSHGPPDQTRPDQTSSIHPSDGADKPPAATKTRGRQLPEDFRPKEKHVTLAAEQGVDLRAEWPKFVDHHRAHGSVMKDWDAALRKWIRNVRAFGPAKPQLALVEDPSLLPPVQTSWMERRS